MFSLTHVPFSPMRKSAKCWMDRFRCNHRRVWAAVDEMSSFGVYDAGLPTAATAVSVVEPLKHGKYTDFNEHNFGNLS